MFEHNRWRSLHNTHVQFRITEDDTVEFNNPMMGFSIKNLEVIVVAWKFAQRMREREQERMKPTDRMLDDILEGMA